MCLVAFAQDLHPRFPWVCVSNRDEYFHRPATAMDWWRPAGATQDILAGRDVSAGGSWLGLTRGGRLALLTNVREPGRFDAAAPSRGELVLQALQHTPQDVGWLDAVARVPRNGYNLLLADLHTGQASWVGNRPQPQQRALGPGLYGLSNAALDTPWPKVQKLKQRLADALRDSLDAEQLAAAAFAALLDTTPAADDELPATGVPLLRERQLSPAFIRIVPEVGSAAGVYGTRCSTVVIVERQAARRSVSATERRFGDGGAVSGESRHAYELAAAAPS